MRQTLVIAAALVAGFVGGILGTLVTRAQKQSRPEQLVRARSFELVDETGRVISYWGIDRRNYAVLAFGSYWPKDSTEGRRGSSQPASGLDEPSNQRAAFGVIDDYPFLTMNGSDGKPRITLNLSIYEKPLLTMWDDSGKRLLLGVAHTDTPSADDNDWFLRFEPDRARIGMGTGVENGQKYVQGFLYVNRDKVKSPYGGPR